MVRIIQEQPRQSFSSLLGQKLGEGLGSGLSKGAETAMQLRGEKTKRLSEVPRAASRVSKQFKSLSLQDPAEFMKFQKSVEDLVNKGYSPDDAALLAYNNYTQAEEGPIAGQLTKDKQGFGTDVTHGLAKGVRPFARAADIPGGFLELLKGATQEATGADKLPSKIREAQAGPFGGFIPSVTEFYDKLTGGAGKPTNAVERAIEGFPLGPAGVAGSYAGEALNIPGIPESVKTAGDFVGFMLAHRYMPKGTPKLSSGAKDVMSRAEKVAASTGESVESVLDKAAADSGVDFNDLVSGDNAASESFMNSLEGRVSKSSPYSFKTEKGSVYEVEGNSTIRNKAYRREHGSSEQGLQPQSETTFYVSKADAEKLGEFQAKGHDKKIVELPDGRIGIMYTSGPNAGKVESRTVVTPNKNPDVGLIPLELWEGGERAHFGNKIIEVNKNKISELEKKPFEPGKETARREKTAESLREAPLQEYYDIEERAREKEAKRSPEKMAEEKLRSAELEPKEKALIAEHHKIREELRTKKNTALKSELSRIEKQLSDLRYEKRHGRPPPTDAEVNAQIKTSEETLRSEAKNPTAEGQAKIERDLKNDEKYLEHMEKVSGKGPISQEFNPDTYIKMNEKYLKAYKDTILKETELMKEMSSEAKLRSKRFIGYLEGRVKGLQAKIVRQAEKIKAMKALEKPSGAFYKNMIKQTRNDLKQFKKDLFTHRKRVMNIEDVKARTVAKKAIAERAKPIIEAEKIEPEKIEKFSEAAAKDPSKENVEKVSEETGASPKEVKKSIIDLKKILGRGLPSDTSIRGILMWLLKVKAAGLAGSFAIGAIGGAVEEATGGKVSRTLTGNLIRKIFGSHYTGFTKEGYEVVRDYFEEQEVKNLESMSPGKRDQYFRQITEKRGSAAAKRIRDIINEKREKKSA